MEFDKENAVAIKNSRKLLNDNNLELKLTFIKANYGNLPKYITTLETSTLSLADAINIIAQRSSFLKCFRKQISEKVNTFQDNECTHLNESPGITLILKCGREGQTNRYNNNMEKKCSTIRKKHKLESVGHVWRANDSIFKAVLH
ncbi:Hypothetical protein CINCED_3A019818 [Cinara cedri]|uniref:Uncharacterized protein n=1 Tax=Cinara cedri TaxID=506608 RepID=A0A5E4MUA6_9HEMI|nr:Hypothetical protein CINCED_3A019818 [Cinara cedri]